MQYTFQTPGLYGFRPVSLFQRDNGNNFRSIPHELRVQCEPGEVARVEIAINGGQFVKSEFEGDSWVLHHGTEAHFLPTRAVFEGERVELTDLLLSINESKIGEAVEIRVRVEVNGEQSEVDEFIAGHVGGAETYAFVLTDPSKRLWVLAGEDDVNLSVVIQDADGNRFEGVTFEVAARIAEHFAEESVELTDGAPSLVYPLRLLVFTDKPGAQLFVE